MARPLILATVCYAPFCCRGGGELKLPALSGEPSEDAIPLMVGDDEVPAQARNEADYEVRWVQPKVVMGPFGGCIRRDDASVSCWDDDPLPLVWEDTATGTTHAVRVVMGFGIPLVTMAPRIGGDRGWVGVLEARHGVSAWGNRDYDMVPEALGEHPRRFISLHGNGEELCGLDEEGDIVCTGLAPAPAPGAVEVVVGQTDVCVRMEAGDVICGDDTLDTGADGASEAHKAMAIDISPTSDRTCILSLDGDSVACRLDQDAPWEERLQGRLSLGEATDIAVDDQCVCVVTTALRAKCECEDGVDVGDLLDGELRQNVVAVDLWNRLCVSDPNGSWSCWGPDDMP